VAQYSALREEIIKRVDLLAQDYAPPREMRLTMDTSLLDTYVQRLENGNTHEAMRELVAELSAQRRSMGPGAWKAYVDASLLTHPLRELLHRDPFTLRAYAKPRGYAGDAPTLDMIYGKTPAGSDLDPVARRIHAYTTSGPAPRAVRERRARMASLIDDTVRCHPTARILSIAAGHFREIELVTSLNGEFQGELVALDQDAGSLHVVDKDYGHLGVRTVCGSVKRLLLGKGDLGTFDLVYSSGLFDYLADGVARMLCERMFRLLNPGGRMMIVNFLHDIPDVGYMEAFMGWYLIYRSEAELLQLCSGIRKDAIAEVRLSYDAAGKNMAYLELRNGLAS
jgi:hypothetical protein